MYAYLLKSYPYNYSYPKYSDIKYLYLKVNVRHGCVFTPTPLITSSNKTSFKRYRREEFIHYSSTFIHSLVWTYDTYIDSLKMLTQRFFKLKLIFGSIVTDEERRFAMSMVDFYQYAKSLWKPCWLVIDEEQELAMSNPCTYLCVGAYASDSGVVRLTTTTTLLCCDGDLT